MDLLRGWRMYYEMNTGAGGAGGAVAEMPPASSPPAVAPSAAPPVPPAPVIDPAEHARLLTENARLAALVEFPRADRETLAMVSGTPEQIRAAAERLHSLNVQQQPAPAPAAAPTGSAPTPVPGAGAAIAPQEQFLADHQRLAREIRDPHRRRKVDPADVEDVRDTAFAIGWNKHIAQRKSSRSVG